MILACCANPALQARSLWTVDPAHTRITFVVDAVGLARTGRFTNFQGQIAIDFDNPCESSVSFKVAASSVDIGSPTFNDYLRGEPFFNAANFPYISFISTSVEKADARLVHVFEVDGKLAGTGQKVGFKATGTIDRRDFGMNSDYPVISEQVRLTVTTDVVGEP